MPAVESFLGRSYVTLLIHLAPVSRSGQCFTPPSVWMKTLAGRFRSARPLFQPLLESQLRPRPWQPTLATCRNNQILLSAALALPASPRSYSSSHTPPAEPIEMAKPKFELKTPKGTKDCKWADTREARRHVYGSGYAQANRTQGPIPLSAI